LQTKNSWVEENGEQIMKTNLQNFMLKENFEEAIIDFFYVGHLYCVNDINWKQGKMIQKMYKGKK